MKVDDTVQPRDRLAENLFERRSVRITEIDRIHMNRAADMQLLGDFMLDIVHHIMAGRNIDSGIDLDMHGSKNLAGTVIMYKQIMDAKAGSGASPSSGLTVSRTRPMPDQTMNKATKTPI